MIRCLIISNLQSSIHAVAQLLDHDAVTLYKKNNLSEVKKILEQHFFDVIVVELFLQKDNYELIKWIHDNCNSGLITLIDHGTSTIERNKLSAKGIIWVDKPLDLTSMQQAIILALTFHNKISILQEENRSLHEQLKAFHLINRAKCVLVKQMYISESEAHHYIEKQAMDQRKSKIKIAMKILRKYE